jgi:hypothetical protein
VLRAIATLIACRRNDFGFDRCMLFRHGVGKLAEDEPAQEQ